MITDTDIATVIDEQALAIASRAMLVEFHRKYTDCSYTDKKKGESVAADEGGRKEASRLNRKPLANDEDLKAISQAQSAGYAHHRRMTLPWSESHDLLLASNFDAYCAGHGQPKAEFERAVRRLLNNWDAKWQIVKFNLGNAADMSRLPTRDKLESKFGYEYTFMPVPTKGDFRVEMTDEQKASLNNSVSNLVVTRINSAVEAATLDLLDPLERMIERLGEDQEDGKPQVFRDTLVTNLRDIATKLGEHNALAGNTVVTHFVRSVRALTLYDPDELRRHESLRRQVAGNAQRTLAEIKEKMAAYLQ